MNLDTIINYNLYTQPKKIERTFLIFSLYGLYFILGLPIIAVPYVFLFTYYIMGFASEETFIVIFISIFITSPIAGKIILKGIKRKNSLIPLTVDKINKKIDSNSALLYGTKSKRNTRRNIIIIPMLLLILNVLFLLLILEAFSIVIGIIAFTLGIVASIIYSIHLYKEERILKRK